MGPFFGSGSCAGPFLGLGSRGGVLLLAARPRGSNRAHGRFPGEWCVGKGLSSKLNSYLFFFLFCSFLFLFPRLSCSLKSYISRHKWASMTRPVCIHAGITVPYYTGPAQTAWESPLRTAGAAQQAPMASHAYSMRVRVRPLSVLIPSKEQASSSQLAARRPWRALSCPARALWSAICALIPIYHLSRRP